MINDEVNLDVIDFEGITESPKSLKELIVSIHGCLHNNIAGKNVNIIPEIVVRTCHM